MSEEMFRAIMKEWYWIVIVLALALVAFAPSFLKAKCPRCRKSSLSSIDLDEQKLLVLKDVDDRPYLTFFNCTACGSRFIRERSGPYEDASAEKWSPLFLPPKSV